MDSIIQAAGRCNRNGEYGVIKDVYVVNAAEENLTMLKDIKSAADAAYRVLEKKPESLTAPSEIEKFYEYYFYNRNNEMYYPLKNDANIYDLLSENQKGKGAFAAQGGKRFPALRQAFASAGEQFFVIDKNRINVLVPFEEGENLYNLFLKADLQIKAGL